MNVFFVTIAVSFAASLLAAVIAEHFLTERVALLGSFAGLQLSHNTGVAFGVTFPPLLQSLLITAALVIVARLAWTTARTAGERIAFGMILGGALGNIADRLADGRVTDFFQVGTFPIFNVADSFVTIGVALLLVDRINAKRRGGD